MRTERTERGLFDNLCDAMSFSYAQKRDWHIYGARHQHCPKCKAEPFTPCHHLSDPSKENRWPHEERVDYVRIYDGMFLRGYITTRAKLDNILDATRERQGIV